MDVEGDAGGIVMLAPLRTSGTGGRRTRSPLGSHTHSLQIDNLSPRLAVLLDKPTITPSKLVVIDGPGPSTVEITMLWSRKAKGKVDVESAKAAAVGELKDTFQGGTKQGALELELDDDVRKRLAVHVQRGTSAAIDVGSGMGGLDDRLKRRGGRLPSGSGARAEFPSLSSGRPCAAALPSSSQAPSSLTVASVTFAPIADGEEEAVFQNAYAGSSTAARIDASPLRPAPSKHETLTAALQPPAAERPTEENERFVEMPASPAATFAERKVVPARDGAAVGDKGSA